jgi:hypothetical protein
LKTKYCKASGTGGRNQPKSLSGIETKSQPKPNIQLPSRNQPKSLSGIETIDGKVIEREFRAGINLNPYQGLKLSVFQQSI